MAEAAEDGDKMTSQQALCDPDQGSIKRPGISTLKLFIMALSFACFSKALAGTYMKSSITQIERRFDLSSTHVGLIDGSFEMGNLLFLAVVSHFGAKLHRPRLIAVGCFLMAVGSFLTGLTHFFMGRYKYNTIIQVFQNESMNIAACRKTEVLEIQIEPSVEDNATCERESGSNMWIYVFLGNALRGIGETPVTPLGISYIDDFARAENSPFYIACLQTITLLGPMFGFLLGSYCAKLYVDIGYVDIESVSITPKDARWVGAWWMGFMVSSVLLLLSSIPFWFLPRSLPNQEEVKGKLTPGCDTLDGAEDVPNNNNHNLKLTDISKGFVPSLKRLLGTPSYFLLLCGSILKFNSFIGLFTFKAKYMEQQFGQSASRANFLIGMLNLPAVAVGIFLGGLLMKSLEPSVITSPWPGSPSHTTGRRVHHPTAICSSQSVTETARVQRRSGTPCAPTAASPTSLRVWLAASAPVDMVFNNCSCVSASLPAGSSRSVRLGQCPHAADCGRSFTAYMAVSVLSSFINSLGATPGYMVIIRCISPDLKSLALGIQALVTRTLGGLPAPVYFGALIDSTCLKWSIKKCGGMGACRIYDSNMYRIIFLGLITSLSGSSYFFIIAVIVLLRRQFREPQRETQTQNSKASEGIDLRTASKPTEDDPGNPKPPKVCIRFATELEEGGEVHRIVQLSQIGRLSSSNITGETQQLKSLTETAVEFTPPSEEAKTEEKEGKGKVCEETDTQVEKEDDLTDANVGETETTQIDGIHN
ncbi:solute carrier organic anion transporter family member 1C1-like isoform X2 [Pseudoliparis swirei]|uniref:solute carrier organic anion transporter family member 1C1-like isoform X2 n=1 Tax=Pseudoliparis swirei TaxID=2059687 RepID=UPI0024BF0DDA|nr:solute carrier organic anion transporter family member 1C1-like isoform X2 [Pseudoliparis swirei]